MQISFLNGENAVVTDEIVSINNEKTGVETLEKAAITVQNVQKQGKDENTLCELEIKEDENSKEDVNIVKTGGILDKIGDLIDKIFGKDKKDKDGDDTKDGKIGPTKQGNVGDCWLLSGINALSYTEKGRELIKNALEYEEGYTIVHLKGFGDVVVKDDELKQKNFSSGDSDMLIFELAIKKVFEKIQNGEVALDPDAPWYMEDAERLSSGGPLKENIEGGYTNEILYLLTGKDGSMAYNLPEKEEMLEEFKKNGNKDKTLNASCQKYKTATDIDGNEINFAGPHAYAVKEVKDGVVTLTNPWDSSKEIKLDTKTFLETFDNTSMVDLGENNPSINHISRTYKIDKDGNKVFVFDRSDRDDYVNDRMQTVKFSKEEITYSPDGIITKRTFYNTDGTRSLMRTFDPKTGKQTGFMTYSKDGKKALCTDFDNEGEITYRLADCDENGNPKHWYYIDNEEDIEKLNDRGLMNYSQFNADEIHFLLKLTDEEWAVAEKYLSKNPNAGYDDIMKKIFG